MRTRALAGLAVVLLVLLGLQTVATAVESAPRLPPGQGEPTLLPTMSGEGPRAIARWDVVPDQAVTTPLHVGVLAFHITGIDRVVFSAGGGSWVAVGQPSVNPRHGVREYHALLAPQDFPPGMIELRAVAYPVQGRPRLLPSLRLFVGEADDARTWCVSRHGNDAFAGTTVYPLATIGAALSRARGGDVIELRERGVYAVGGASNEAQHLDNGRWITVRPAPGLQADEVTLVAPQGEFLRPNRNRIRWRGVSFDFARIRQIYPEDSQVVWFDRCRWHDADGWAHKRPGHLIPVRNAQYIGGYYATDCVAQEMLYGFVDAELVRGCLMRRISGDALQNSRMVVHCRVDEMDGALLRHHSDLLQYFGHYRNLIIYGVTARRLRRTQALFLDHHESSFTDCAFVNIFAETYDDNPPFSQLNSSQEHVLFLHVSTPEQRWMIRDDLPGAKAFRARDVLLLNSVLGGLQTPGGRGRALPPGVTIRHCHFVGGTPHGERASYGPVLPRVEADWSTRHEGESAGVLDGTGCRMRGLDLSPDGGGEIDRGACGWRSAVDQAVAERRE